MIRPTGLLDPEIILKNMDFIVDIMSNLQKKLSMQGRECHHHDPDPNVKQKNSQSIFIDKDKVQYLHEEVDTLGVLKYSRSCEKEDIYSMKVKSSQGMTVSEVSKLPQF
jgi:excinuclease UvrABC helicase subunit UvrB